MVRFKAPIWHLEDSKRGPFVFHNQPSVRRVRRKVLPLVTG